VTKRPLPLTFDAALARIAGHLRGGWAEMAQVAERKERTVRNWGDPDTPEDVPAGAMLKLDLAYQAAGGQGAPLFEAYANQLDLAEAARFADRHELLARAERLIREGGEGHAALVRACQPRATERDRANAFRELSEAFAEFKPLLALLSPDAPSQNGRAHQAEPQPP
jgi:hypothetical protein